MADIELEREMFKYSREKGIRAIKRGNNVIIQKTIDNGATWVNYPLNNCVITVTPDGYAITNYTGTLSLSDARPNVRRAIESKKLVQRVEKSEYREYIYVLGIYCETPGDIFWIWGEKNHPGNRDF